MQERNIDRLPHVRATTRDQTYNLDICPDQESNPPPSSIQDDAPTNRTTLLVGLLVIAILTGVR